MNNIIHITTEYSDRLDKICSEKTDISRTKINRLIKDGMVSVNHKTIIKPSFLVIEHQLIEIVNNVEENILKVEAENIPINIIYEDDFISVLSKAYGMVVHPSPGNYSGTLVNALLHHYTNLSTDDIRPGIVHRLDKDTSGIMVIAKNDFAHQSLTKQLQERSMSKYYLALVAGNFKNLDGKIIKPIARSKVDRKKMCIDANGRYAETYWKLLENAKGCAFILVKIITGRTHQIRVHMSSISHPIIGDIIYNNNYKQNNYRLMLHAYSLSFTHPKTNERLNFKAPLSNEYISVLNKLGISVNQILDTIEYLK